MINIDKQRDNIMVKYLELSHLMKSVLFKQCITLGETAYLKHPSLLEIQVFLIIFIHNLVRFRQLKLINKLIKNNKKLKIFLINMSNHLNRSHNNKTINNNIEKNQMNNRISNMKIMIIETKLIIKF